MRSTGDGASDTPPVIAGAVRLFVSGALACVLGAIAWLVLRKLQIVPRSGVSRFVPLAMGLAPIVVLLPFWHWRVRRLRRALFASRFRLCTRCGYDVSTLGETGICPECGGAYDAEADVALWERQGAPYTEPRPRGFMAWSRASDGAPPADGGGSASVGV